MNKIVAFFSIAIAIILFSSCQDEASYMPQIEQMKDSIFATYPTVGAITIKVEDRSNLKIVLGDEQLFKAPQATKIKEAGELGQMAVRIFGPNSFLHTGQLVVTKDVHNSSETPGDGISTPINIDALKQNLTK
jgi:hypothetical protein